MYYPPEFYKLPPSYNGVGIIEFTTTMNIRINNKAWADIKDATKECQRLTAQGEFMQFKPGNIGYAWNIAQDKVGNYWAWFDPAGTMIACVRYKGKDAVKVYRGFDVNDEMARRPRPTPTPVA